MLPKIKEDNIMAEKYNTTVRITDFDINWKKIKSACMTTISKEAGDKEPSHEWKRKLLQSTHQNPGYLWVFNLKHFPTRNRRSVVQRRFCSILIQGYAVNFLYNAIKLR